MLGHGGQEVVQRASVVQVFSPVIPRKQQNSAHDMLSIGDQVRERGGAREGEGGAGRFLQEGGLWKRRRRVEG